MSDNVVARLRELLAVAYPTELIVEAVNALPALLDVVEEARLFLGDGGADSDDLCAAVNRVMRDIDGHDWSEWDEPYECGAGMCHIRHCRTCGDYEARPVWAGDA